MVTPPAVEHATSRPRKFSLPVIKDVMDIASKGVTILAIIAAGFWFWLQAEAENRLNVELVAESRALTVEWVLVSTQLKVTNVGRRPVDVDHMRLRIQQVLPLDAPLEERLAAGASLIHEKSDKVRWPRLASDYEMKDTGLLRPGEVEHFFFDHIVPAYVTVVRLYGELGDGRKDLVWASAIYHDVAPKGANSK